MIICYHNQIGGRHTDSVGQLMERANFVPFRKIAVGDLLGALGLVEAEARICIVPATVQRMRNFDVAYKPLAEVGALSTIFLTTAKGWNSTIVKQTKDELERLINAESKSSATTFDVVADPS